MEKYKNKYRIPSARAQWWDYGWNGAYFITICTKNREHFFGEIRNGKMELSQVGVLADIFWYEIPNHTSCVELGDFVVMPNHVHGILILDKPDGGMTTVETLHATSLPQPPRAETVSSIIRSYKSAVTHHANRLGFDNGWQERFYDIIIRDDIQYQRISDYIVANPKRWKEDKFYRKDA